MVYLQNDCSVATIRAQQNVQRGLRLHAHFTKVITMKTKPSAQQLNLRKAIKGKQELSLLTHTLRHSIDLELLISVFEDMGITDPAVIQPLKKVQSTVSYL